MPFPFDVPVLTDGVVTLRAHSPGDTEELLEQALDPLVVAWTTVPVPSTFDTSHAFATEIIPRGWDSGTSWAFAVEAVDDTGRARFSGSVELRPEGDGRAEIAYAAHPSARGRGLMERACRLLLEWGFEEKRLDNVIWWSNRGNWASRRLAWSLGFSCDGVVARRLSQRGVLHDAWVGTLGHDELRAPRNPWLEVPHLVGTSVVLRPDRSKDVPRIVEACSDERTAHWLGQMPSPYTAADAEAWLTGRRERQAEGVGVHWAVADPASDELLANVAVFDVKARHEAEVGYWTHPDARGRGVMTEAVGLAVRHCFVPEEDGGLGLQRVAVFAAEANTASRRVIEANGFREQGRERRSIRLRDGSLADSIGYDLLVEEYVGPAEDEVG